MSLGIIECCISTGTILLNIIQKKYPEHLEIPGALSYKKKSPSKTIGTIA